MSILNILNKLSATASKLEKQAILQAEVSNPLLKEVFHAAYNPMINYWIIKIPPYASNPKAKKTLEDAIHELGVLSSRQITGNAAISFLNDLLSAVSTDDATVLERVIGRDLRVGCSETTANKVWPGLIPTFDVCLAHKDISGITYPAYAQVKADGMRVHLLRDAKGVTAYTRSGKVADFKGALDAAGVAIMKVGEVWDGEVVFRKSGTNELLDRKTSNGLGNKAVKGTLSEKEAKDVVFMTWDLVDFSSTIPYSKRLKEMTSRFSHIKKDNDLNIWMLDTVTVNTSEEAGIFYNGCIADGQEGAVLKNIDFLWQGKRVKDMGKIKAEEEADLVIVGWEEGTGKNVGKLGALVGETSDGLLRTSVGTGWSDKQRGELTAKNTKGKIMTVRYNQIIRSKGKDVACLFSSRVVEIRIDKTVANTLEELK